MKRAEEVVKKYFKEKGVYEKCSVCGLYGTEEEMKKETFIKGTIYVDVCCNCMDYLEKGGKIKKRKFFVEELEDIENNEEEEVTSETISY